MSYIDKAAMITRFGEVEIKQLTDKARTGSIVDAVLDAALSDSQSEIDGYLADEYALPITDTVPLLTAIQADVCRYILYENKATEEVTDRYLLRVETLKKIQKGIVKLVDDTGAVVGSDSPVSDGPQFCASARQWDDAGLDDY